MIDEIVRKLLALENIDDTTSEGVLLWTQEVEAQRVHKEVLNKIKVAKDFDSLRENMQKKT